MTNEEKKSRWNALKVALCKEIFAQVYVIRICNILSIIQMSVTGRRYLLANIKLKSRGGDGDQDIDKGILDILNDENNLRKEEDSDSEEGNHEHPEESKE